MRTRLLVLAACLAAPWIATPAAAKPATAPAAAAARPSRGDPRASAAMNAGKTKPASAKKAGLASKTSKKKPAPPPCFAKPVRFMRQRGSDVERATLSLTYCDGRANPAALDELSVLARSRDVDAPSPSELRAYAARPTDKGARSARRDPMYLSQRVMRLHPDLLLRLQKIADRFPGRLIDIVSGHRPEARSTSRHHHGRALDLRVDGVSRERVRDFARTLEGTGVGYYPNSVFTHVDVRDDKGYWVDRSGPGEKADYGTWPPRPREIDDVRESVLADAYAAVGGLGDLALLEPTKPRAEHAPSERVIGSRTNVDAARSAAEAFERAASSIGAPRPVSVPLPAPRTDAAPRTEPAPAARIGAPVARPAQRRPPDDEGGKPLSADEVARIRADALKALAKLR